MSKQEPSAETGEWEVVITQDGETARLSCSSHDEALKVKVSFENYGKCQDVRIVRKERS